MILQIVGFKDSGKTTLLQQSVTFLKSQGYHIVTIKHHGHHEDDITLQSSNVDHMKHFEAGADQSIVQGLAYQQTVTRRNQPSLEQLIRESVTISYDVILVEGFKNENYDKIVVYNNKEELEKLRLLTRVKYFYNYNNENALKDYEQWLLNWLKQKDEYKNETI
ncbi:molybdopterin-guanine dinucleotide biosynthesis adapter protein [Staphylococcus hominis]